MHVWDRRFIYNLIGVTGDTIPREMHLEFGHDGQVVVLSTTEEKKNHYRIHVHCQCGQVVAFCKMPQHLRGKRHMNHIQKEA